VKTNATATWGIAAVALAGAAVMAVEVLGARLLGVVFGATPAVWGAMIALTLLALAVGYFAGGWAAERAGGPATAAAGMLLAGGWIAIAPWLRPAVKACCGAFGVERGALAASALVFAVPLALLGMVSPIVIRLLTARGARVGVTAGGVYALGTLGGATGTLAAAFWLIPVFGLTAGFRIVGLLAAATGALGLSACLRRGGVGGLLVPVAIALFPIRGLQAGDAYTAPDGARVLIEAVRDSRQGRIAVLRKGDYRVLAVDGIAQTGMRTDVGAGHEADGLLDGYYLGLIPYAFEDCAGRRALVIGLAGGMTPSVLAAAGMRTDCVEIDPVVAAMAREHFGYRGNVVIADGRRYLESCAERYDVCVLDAYGGEVLPPQLGSREAFQAAKRAMTKDGALAVNFIGAPRGRALAAVARTLREVFGHVLALKSEPGDDVQAITLFAADRAVSFNRGWLGDLGEFTGEDPVSARIRRDTFEPSDRDAMVLTDDRNPLDLLRAREAVRWRERALANLGLGAGW
jgi:spermidine synthase